MKEKRRAERRKISYYFKALSSNTLELVGHLTDVSKVGINLDCPNPVKVGEILNLSIETTPDVSETELITFKAQCKWCRTDVIVPNVFNTGFEILEISPHDAQVLQLIQEQYGTKK